jgi:ribosomal-protein-alanine N-acetyltransferase
MHILDTERLRLRRLLAADLQALHALYRDPEMRRWIPEGTPTLEETRIELEHFMHGHPQHPGLGLWATIEKSSGAFLGRCGLLPWTIAGKTEVELAFMIDKSRWGEGFATEAGRGIAAYARDRLGLVQLICLVMPGNLASAKVAQKVGMRFEREDRDEWGAFHIYRMALAPPH